MIDQELLDILVCPETHQPVRPADGVLLGAVNTAIRAGGVKTVAGQTVEAPLDAALVREDGLRIYPVRDDIPIMLIDESIDWTGPSSSDEEE